VKPALSQLSTADVQVELEPMQPPQQTALLLKKLQLAFAIVSLEVLFALQLLLPALDPDQFLKLTSDKEILNEILMNKITSA